MSNVNAFATWVAIVSTIIGGSVWVGAVAQDVQNNKEATAENRTQVDTLRKDGPPAIARLEAKQDALQRDMDDVKQTQKEILKELRK